MCACVCLRAYVCACLSVISISTEGLVVFVKSAEILDTAINSIVHYLQLEVTGTCFKTFINQQECMGKPSLGYS